MKRSIYEILRAAQAKCNAEKRGTEYILQYMQDEANVDLDCVLQYLKKYGGFKK